MSKAVHGIPFADVGEPVLAIDDSAALEETSVSKASAGRVYHVDVFNGHASSTLFFQIHNKASAPVAPDAPLVSLPVPPQGTLSLSYGEYGKPFGTGISWGCSTTQATFTAGGTNFWVNMGFK